MGIEPDPKSALDVQWVDEVASLLPEESRLGWYRNIRPWLRTLPPDDEVAHLAYSMGYLALLTRSAPALVAAERATLTALLQRFATEVTGAVKTTADYHKKLSERLSALPAEIAQGLSPSALAGDVAAGVRTQFLNSGVPEAGRLLKEQGDYLRQLVADQTRTLSEFRQQLNESRNHVNAALQTVVWNLDAAKNSIDKWDREMRQVQWLYLGGVWLIGLLLGALLYWWLLAPQEAGRHQQEQRSQQPEHASPRPGTASRWAPK
jgi:hypothetical protein